MLALRRIAEHQLERNGAIAGSIDENSRIWYSYGLQKVESALNEEKGYRGLVVGENKGQVRDCFHYNTDMEDTISLVGIGIGANNSYYLVSYCDNL